MNPVQSHPGSYWRSNDPADIRLNTSAPEKPETIEVFDFDSNSGPHQISIASLRFVNAGIFGEGRPCSFNSKVKWTGDSYRYGVYLFEEDPDEMRPVILETDGGGTRGIIFPAYTTDLWSVIAVGLLPPQLWDMCHSIMKYGASMQKCTETRIYQAFAEGRLIKKKWKGNTSIKILPIKPAL
jgi:hypothetical protein